MSARYEDAKEQLKQAEQNLQEAIENKESAKVIERCRSDVRYQRQRVTKYSKDKE